MPSNRGDKPGTLKKVLAIAVLVLAAWILLKIIVGVGGLGLLILLGAIVVAVILLVFIVGLWRIVWYGGKNLKAKDRERREGEQR
jgi:hypothetical protein